MTPILAKLKTEYAGSLEVKFIDVWKEPEVGKEYGIRSIPTQIFFDATGRERFRHTGFMSKEDILAKRSAARFDAVLDSDIRERFNIHLPA
jgi:thioredoxin 1